MCPVFFRLFATLLLVAWSAIATAELRFAAIGDLKLDSGEEAMTVAEPFIKTRQKNPAMAINADGDRLIVWGEAISHTRGGRLNMHLFAVDGSDKGAEFAEEIAIPNFSFPAAAVLPSGDFLVLY